MKSDELEKLQERRTYLVDWLERNKKAQDMLPIIQQLLARTDLGIQTLSNLPEEAEDIPRDDLLPIFIKENDELKVSLPMLPRYDDSALQETSDHVTSGTATAVTTLVTRVLQIDTTSARSFGETYFTEYRKIQESQSRQEIVRKLLGQFGHQEILQRFDIALSAYAGAQSHVVNVNGAASDIRTFLYKFKGELFGLAKKWPKENMSWEKMAHRLSRGEYEKSIIINREKNKLFLESQLSDITKAREELRTHNLEYIWPQVLEHIYIIMRSIDIAQK